MKEIRKRLGMTQQYLAAGTGIPVRTIQKYESGQYSIKNMTVGKAVLIAKALNVSVEQLLEENS